MPRIGFESSTAITGVIDGRELVVFGGCNYLGLAHHQAVQQAMTRGVGTWGLTTTASRETTGNTTAHDSLEREVATFLGLPAAILTTEGYTANLALGQGLAGDVDVAVVDEKSHSSVMLSMQAPGFQVETYRHLDASHAVALVLAHRSAGRRVVLMADGVFAAGGGVTPLHAILAALPSDSPTTRAGVRVIIDDCHAFAVLGAGGRGLAEHFGVAQDPRLIITTTFAKGLGCYGGVIAGPLDLITRIRERSLVYRGTTPCPPPLIEAAREALRVIDREPELLGRLRANVLQMRNVLSRVVAWKPAQHPSLTGDSGAGGTGEALVPIFVFWHDPVTHMHAVQRELSARGFFVPLIDYPGGPTPWYFRATVTASHTSDQIDRFGEALVESLVAAGIEPSVAPRPAPTNLLGTADARVMVG